MKYNLSVIICFLTLNLSFSQNKFDGIYGFINDVNSYDTKAFHLKKKAGFKSIIRDSSSVFKDSLFTKRDLDTFKLQLSQTKVLSWKESEICNSIILPSKKIKRIFKKENGWVIFHKKYGDCLTSFSIPLFSSDMKYCIFYQWKQCDDVLGAGNGAIYEKQKGKWVVIKFLMHGVS